MNQAEASWAELLGSNHWDGLSDPLDLNLRQLILRCGDLCQCTYDTFINDNSKYTGSSRYGKKHFFKKLLVWPKLDDYEVICFLYATADIDVPGGFIVRPPSGDQAWSRESNWIGYIAVSSDKASRELGRREIYVAWRGTIRNLEWANVVDFEAESIEPLLAKEDQHRSHWFDGILGIGKREEPKVMNGWYNIYTSDNPNSPFNKLSARQQFVSKIKDLVSLYKDEDLSLICTGHSLGSCLAILSAFDAVENGLSKATADGHPFLVTAIVFGSPQVGNKAFNERLKKLPNLRVLHVRNVIDLITRYPSGLLGFVDTESDELVIDTRKSPYLKDSKNPSDWHNLQAILHVVAGWNGKDKEFKLQVERSIALVNKSCDFLKDECLVPGSWWVEKNKGMVLGEDGEWYMASLSEADLPVPEF